MKLFYLKCCQWEIDTIHIEILEKMKEKIETIYYEENEILKLLEYEDAVNNCFIVVASINDYNDVVQVVEKLKPLCIFHLSDECGLHNHWLNLAQYTKILFRQYNQKNHVHSYENIVQIPIGYVTNFLSKKNSTELLHKTPQHREYEFSFVGQLKSDRSTMIEKINKNFDKTKMITVNTIWSLDQLQVKPEEIHEIYEDTIFVAIGRGGFTLECFRIYEAVVSGAIPVIVYSDSDELETIFCFNNNFPPFLFFKSWDDAVFNCKELLKNPTELQNLQIKNLLWWKTMIESIQLKIRNLVEELEKPNPNIEDIKV